jgi:protein subunit release factor A
MHPVRHQRAPAPQSTGRLDDLVAQHATAVLGQPQAEDSERRRHEGRPLLLQPVLLDLFQAGRQGGAAGRTMSFVNTKFIVHVILVGCADRRSFNSQ